MSTKKYYKTEIKVVVLSENPYSFNGLFSLAADVDTGDCSGRTTVVRQDTLNAKQMAAALLEQGSDPEFFGIELDS